MEITFTNGWSSLALAYGLVQAPLVAGLIRGQASLRRYATSPLLAAPLTAVAGITVSAATPLLRGLGADPHGLMQLAFGAAVSVTLGYAAGRRAAHEGDAVSHQRGAVIAAGPGRSRSADRRSRGWAAQRQITLAGRAIPMADETKHFKLIGTTGTGKSTAIQEMLTTALARGDRAVIADPDAGYLKRFHDPARGDVVLNPFDPRSMKWDLFGEIENDYDVEQLARSLIPDQGGPDRSWRGYARTFFSAVTRQMHESGVRDVAELYRMLVVAEPLELRTLLKGTPAQPFLDEHNTRMFDSIRSVTSSAVGALDHIAQQNAPSFSIRQWVQKDSPGVLFIPYKAGQIAALHSTISGWMRLAIFETMNREEQPELESAPAGRLWFVVDELDALGPIDGLKDALARMRKFGGRCVLGFQSIAQVSGTYGPGDAHTIVENCGNTLILRCSASEGGGTARFASQLIGEREVIRTTMSRSRRSTEFFGSVSHSEHYNVEPAVLPSQIEQLPDLAGYLKQASHPDWHPVRLAAVRQWGEGRAIPTGGSSAAAGREPRHAAGREAPNAASQREGLSRD